MMTQILRTAAIAGLALGAGLAAATAAQAQSVTTDESAGYVVFPRIVSDPNDIFLTGAATNTVIQLTNTSDAPVTVHCIYINATGVCSTGINVPGSPGAECRTADDCVGAGATCDQQWDPADFTLILSPQQPTGWVVDTGSSVAPPGDGAIPPVLSDYFVGELKCIQVNDDVEATPVNANDLQGEATLYAVGTGGVDVSAYNAIGIQAVASDGSTQNDKTMCLGGSGEPGDDCENAEYANCPAKLVLGHAFEGAGAGNATASTSLTLSPCSADIVTNVPTGLVAQFLVFNEFEQRMSAATEIECLETHALSDFGTIFNVNVQGTLTGQTHVRPVSTSGAGAGLIGVAEQTLSPGGSSAFHVNNVGEGGVDVVEYVFPVN